MTTVQPFGGSLQLLVQVALLLVVARGLGVLAARIGVTRVVGELATGFVLGASVLGGLAPGLYSALFPDGVAAGLGTLSLLGLVLLLALAGMETDVRLVRRNLRDVVVIGLAGLALPFGLGVTLGLLLPPSLLVDPSRRLVFALFLATALSVSALPVIVRVLIDLDALDRPFGQLTVAVAMFTDAIGWLLLSVVVGLARTGTVDLRSLGHTLIAVVGFVGGAVLLGGRLLDAALSRLGEENATGQVVLVAVAALLGSAITLRLGIEPALGAFVVGLLVARSGDVTERAAETFERVTLGVFAPLFFGVAGLRADLGLLFDPTVALVGTLTLLVASVGKLVGVYAAASWLGYTRVEAFGMGAGLNARGAIEIVVATIGLELGLLGPEMYTVVIGVAILTSAMAPPMLRAALRRLDPVPGVAA